MTTRFRLEIFGETRVIVFVLTTKVVEYFIKEKYSQGRGQTICTIKEIGSNTWKKFYCPFVESSWKILTFL